MVGPQERCTPLVVLNVDHLVNPVLLESPVKHGCFLKVILGGFRIDFVFEATHDSDHEAFAIFVYFFNVGTRTDLLLEVGELFITVGVAPNCVEKRRALLGESSAF